MLEKSKTFTVQGLEEIVLQAMAWQTLQELGWNIHSATGTVLVAFTPTKWSTWEDQVIIETRDNRITVTSKLVHGEFWDLFEKNRKHINRFLSAFWNIKASATGEQIETWKKQVELLKEKTIEETEKEVSEAIAMDQVMHFSTGHLHFTYCIIGINILVFLMMILSGDHFASPHTMQMLKWGANHPLLVFGGQWWRLVTSVFLHYGFIHLAMNMVSLYFIGSYMEPMLGKGRYIIAYLGAGVVASLTSVLWHKEEMIISAGASGAIFGLFGVFLILLVTRVVPRQIRGVLLISVLLFIVYNVARAFSPDSRIDNAAHLGGLGTGMLIGIVYYYSFKQPSMRKTQNITAGLALGILLFIFALYRIEKTSSARIDFSRNRVVTSEQEKREEERKNNEKFSSTLEHFRILEEMALEAMEPADTLTKAEALKALQKTALVDWTECVNLMEQSKDLLLPERMHRLRKGLIQYSNQRMQQTFLMIKAREEETNKYQPGLDSIQQVITEQMAKIREEYESGKNPEPRQL